MILSDLSVLRIGKGIVPERPRYFFAGLFRVGLVDASMGPAELATLQARSRHHCLGEHSGIAQSNQFESFQLQPVGTNVGEVVLRLLHQPAFGAASENLR